ncbi:MAG: reverse transcriptase domain-containing protein, partial [Nitrososphaerales archaeon]
VWKGRVYEFQVLPFSISSAPRAFTKLMREPIAVLRAEGLRLVIYIDDILILGGSIEEIKSHADKALSLLQELGFRIKWEKCQLEPTQRVKFLGFIVDSVKMTLSLPHDKIHKIRKESRQLLKISTTTLRKLASFLGLLASVAPAVSSARLHQNQLLRWKNQLMKVHKGNWDAFISIPSDLQEELLWWRDELHRWNGKSIIQQKPEITIITDASEKGYGGHREDNPQIFVQGAWTTNERQRHNNWRELKAGELVLKKMLKSKEYDSQLGHGQHHSSSLCQKNGGKIPRPFFYLSTAPQLLFQTKHNSSDLKSIHNIRSALSTIFSITLNIQLGTTFLVARYSKGNRFKNPIKPYTMTFGIFL